MEDSELIIKFLEKDLTEEEKALFKTRYESDSSFVEEVNGYLDIMVGLEAASDKKMEITGKSKENKHRVVPIKKVFRVVAAIVLPLLLISSFLFLKDNFAADSIVQNYALLETFGNRGVAETNEALEAYDAGKYEKSIELFEAQPGFAENVEYQFYVGTAYLALKKGEEAVPIFNSIIEQFPGRKTEAQFYLALSHLQVGEPFEASSILQQISQDTPERSFYHARSGEVLEKMNSFWWKIFN